MEELKKEVAELREFVARLAVKPSLDAVSLTTVRRLLNKDNIDMPLNDHQCTFLHASCTRMEPENVEWAISMGANVNAETLAGKTPLMMATVIDYSNPGHEEEFKLIRAALVGAGADPEEEAGVREILKGRERQKSRWFGLF